MPLTEFQANICKLLAKNRSPDSHLAGGAALHFEPNSLRHSVDLDYFHDSEKRVAEAFALDRDLLQQNGYQVQVEINQSTFNCSSSNGYRPSMRQKSSLMRHLLKRWVAFIIQKKRKPLFSLQSVTEMHQSFVMLVDRVVSSRWQFIGLKLQSIIETAWASITFKKLWSTKDVSTRSTLKGKFEAEKASRKCAILFREIGWSVKIAKSRSE